MSSALRAAAFEWHGAPLLRLHSRQRLYGTLYAGVASDPVKRVWEHRNDFVDGFTRTHGVHRLVWYEIHDDVLAAITREKQIKKWNRDWKVNLIRRMNPKWDDLCAARVA